MAFERSPGARPVNRAPAERAPGVRVDEHRPKTREEIQREVDRVVDGTFPASDPPSWGVVRKRQREKEEADADG